MIVFPKAKINLGLRVTEKRPDGYHDIETIFYPVGLSDALEFVVSDGSLMADKLTVSGLDTGSNPEDNLVIKTVKKLREKHTFPFLKIHLHKAIPVGAGLGGGSSDAAYLLYAINKCLKLNLDNKNLKLLALDLGSDCPFFIDRIPAFATGRGEILEPIKPVLNGFYLLILNPRINVNTADAYKNCLPEPPKQSLLHLIESQIDDWKTLILNDFEYYIFKKHPLIGDIKKELYNCGAFFSLMSGSGSSLYGVFSEKPSLNKKLKDFVIYEGIM
jgi:4-diphosphocytidyl-2-C-methyl-D-erythritol kinase